MGEPMPEVMIRDEQGRGQDPRDRIDQQHGLQRVVQRHHHEQPRDAEHDRTDNREEHGAQALAGPANGARRVVDDRVEQVKRRDEVNHRGGVGHDRRVVDEEARKGLDEREEEQRHAPDDPDRDDERDVVSAPHALVVARSEVLRGNRRHGDAERLGDHPDDPVQTGGEPPPGHRIRTEGIHRRLHDDVGDRVQRRLDRQRKARCEHASAEARVDHDI